jgi:hypothetical protein
MDLDPFLLSLVQVAFVVSFHIIFPAFSDPRHRRRAGLARGGILTRLDG